VALDKLLTCAELSVPLVLAPAPSAGSTAPASVPAVVTVGNAEVVAGLVVHQLARPGAPFVYGAGVGVLNMRTAVEVYLAPEAALGDQAACDLARSYGLPSWSYAGMSDSKLLDEQAALEAGLASVFGALSGATLLHDVGYLESGMQSSFEALVLGNEIIGYVKAFLTPLPVSSDTLQLDEIMAVGPGGNHLARPYTRQHHRLLWQADLLDQNMFERWQADGATTLRERVKARTAALCAAAPTFSLDPALEARLQRIVDEALRAAGD
jgi:trimethylamine--corrinoid protein Co-methyltransferase